MLLMAKTFHDLNNKTSQNNILLNGAQMWLEIRVCGVIILLSAVFGVDLVKC
jgi:hypothetical protein